MKGYVRHYPPTSWSVERVRLQTAARQQQPASSSQPTKPAKPASQPIQSRQPANAASGHRSLRPPGLDFSRLFFRGI